MTTESRLAVYGTLAPGKPNHHQLAGLAGRWLPGAVRGRLFPTGWGATLGYPALIPDATAPAVPVQLFLSDDLPAHWARLDAFEGDGYRRVEVEVDTAEGTMSACLYAAAEE